MKTLFESFANSKRYKTLPRLDEKKSQFESFANSKRHKTINTLVNSIAEFESFANSKRYKTIAYRKYHIFRLRALLIQKDTKQTVFSR